MMSLWAAMGNSAEPVVGNQVMETIQRGKIHNVNDSSADNSSAGN
jgi:hypothetical protein